MQATTGKGRRTRFTRGDVLFPFPYFSLILPASPRRDSRLETSSLRIVGRIEFGCPKIPHEEGEVEEEASVAGRPAQVEESHPSTFDLVSVEEVRRSEISDSSIGVSALGWAEFQRKQVSDSLFVVLDRLPSKTVLKGTHETWKIL